MMEEALWNPGDIAWMLTATAFVLFMTPGLALFYGGMVRSKNVLSVLMQNFWCMGIITIVWIVAGYSIAFGGGGSPFLGGVDHLFLNGIAVDYGSAHLPEAVNVVFQLAFAVITPALITGAFAERMKFSAFAIFVAVWSLLVYSPLAHWVWDVGNGFLNKWGVLDFAGGTVIHVNAGVAALVAAIIIGKRKGWPKPGFRPHNLTMTLLGTGILWFGWMGFNAGSAGSASPQAVNAFLVTQVSAATGAVVWAIVEWIKDGKPTTLGVASGGVAALVGITPAAGFVDVQSALIIGATCGVLCYFAIGLKSKLGYDDSLDVVGVHMVGGIIGGLLTGLLADAAIGGTAGGLAQMGKQAVGLGVGIVWSAVLTTIILLAIKYTIGLRVTEEDEERGLDLSLHSEEGYSFAELGATSTASSLVTSSTSTSGG
ncbi:MAG: ammonium transporter [Acidimicrobiia bacterium]|nr:ammonium transporter [Acidimicrobiia bacterium]